MKESTIARAGLAADVQARIKALAARHKAACKAMVDTHFRRDGLVPKDVEVPELPAIPQMPEDYEEVIELSLWHAKQWAPDSRYKAATHREELPTVLASSATPAQAVAALRALEEYVAGVEKMATDYRAAAEEAVAKHIAEQEGHIRTLAEIVAEERAARERRERERAEAERQKAERERAEAAEREEWVREHGSPRLRRLLEEEIEHGAVYFDERLAAERPGWSENAAIPTREPRNAPEEALGLLDEARKTAPDAKLVYWVAYLPCEYCDEDEDDCRCEIDEVRGYTAEATFLGRKIVYQVDEDGVPPVVVD